MVQLAGHSTSIVEPKPGPGGPAERYQALCQSGKLTKDPSQLQIIQLLDQRYEVLGRKRKRFRKSMLIPGLYIHGGVGRGKTMLMDLFAQSLEEAGIAVIRQHFHRFMNDIHQQLDTLKSQRNPLKRVAERLNQQARVLCFDEFHVDDIADAMLLGELTRHWFDQGLTLIATSNTAPDDLYADGLQRQRFEPAIRNIHRYCDIVELTSPEDYRLRQLERHPTWLHPHNAKTETLLEQEFSDLCPQGRIADDSVLLRGRTLTIQASASTVLWTRFSDLCEQPRSSRDYIDLTQRYSTLLLSDIPQMDDDDNNAAKRFIHLIDACYDRAVKMIASANAPIDGIYTGRRLAQEFERTRSRLTEMQTKPYLAQAHRS